MKAALHVDSCAGIGLVQDLGRRGRRHEGLPSGGALAPEMLIAANRAVGNPDDAAGIEVYGRLTFTVAGGTLPVAVAEGSGLCFRHRCEPGQIVPVETAGRCRVAYVAVPGGIDVPEVLGGRGSLPTLGIGHRPLRRGDALPVGPAPASAAAIPFSLHLDLDAPIGVVPGPDLDCFHRDGGEPLLTLCCDRGYEVTPQSDRMGYRLTGPIFTVSRTLEGSTPVCPGAIQALPSGDLVVLGPDGGTTGGYPVPAVVRSSDLGRLLARKPGAKVRFALHEGA